MVFSALWLNNPEARSLFNVAAGIACHGGSKPQKRLWCPGGISAEEGKVIFCTKAVKIGMFIELSLSTYPIRVYGYVLELNY